ncbi:MAG: hypothetical protein KZQ95_21610 [Candidatus Thiodiazotropha sp. (ex Epidulcina cf. delphinae)]|nr:hypothetical protein [Candidatus Thiodiazotropha sp. (ex Epidulcina cf. delphinae)]
MVVGFIILTGLIVYLIISIVMIFFGVRYARKKGIPGWKGGVLTAVVMYLLMFWDFIPFHVAYKYYCATEGGYTLNQTLEAWKEDNPGVAETLVPKKEPEYTKTEVKERYILNQRFAWDIYTTKHILGIRKRDNRVVDVEKGEVLAQYIDFDSNQNSLNPKKFRDFRFWLEAPSCEESDGLRTRPWNYVFNKFMYLVQYQREFAK